MDNKVKELTCEHQNLLGKIKFLEYKYHIMLEKNTPLTLEMDGMKKNLGSQNENFHHSSKILTEVIQKEKSFESKRDLSYISNKLPCVEKLALLSLKKAPILGNHPQSKPVSALFAID